MDINIRSIKMSPPWVVFYRKIDALFGKDPDIKVVYDNEAVEVKLYVNNPIKADAIDKLLPATKDYGFVQLKITVVPSNDKNESIAETIENAFGGNPIFAYTAPVEGVFTNPITYVVFEKEVAQFYADNLGDVNGNYSTLYEDLAKEVFGDLKGIYFCTDDGEDE